VGEVSRALHTSFHRFQVNGETHFANTAPPSVPEALADVVSGFVGLDDFHPKPFSHVVPDASAVNPNFNVGNSHLIAPEDFSTIYNVAHLYQAGMDGTGQSIAVVGQSDIELTDIRAFRTRFGLPANDPRILLYSFTDPGFTGSEVEGDLDVEWAGAIAPKATIYYIYGPSAGGALLFSISANVAPIITNSFGNCEVDFSTNTYRAAV